MCSSKYALCVLWVSLTACATSPRLPMPETCSPMPSKVVCPGETYLFGQEHQNPFGLSAGGFVCYRPADIEPFLEMCGKK